MEKQKLSLVTQLELAFGPLKSHEQSRQQIMGWLQWLMAQKDGKFGFVSAKSNPAAFARLMLLLAIHPHCREKFVGEHSFNHIERFEFWDSKSNTVSLYIKFRGEATSMPISLKKMANMGYTQMTTATEPPQPPKRLWLRTALRNEVMEQIVAFKQAHLATHGHFISAHTNQMIPRAEATVDHAVVPFVKLADDWVNQQGGIAQVRLVLAYGSNTRWLLADEQQAQSWAHFHQQHAQLQILSRHENELVGSYGYACGQTNDYITLPQYLASWLEEQYPAAETVFAAAKVFSQVHKIAFLKVMAFLAGNRLSMTDDFAEKLAKETPYSKEVWLKAKVVPARQSSTPKVTDTISTPTKVTAMPAKTDDSTSLTASLPPTEAFTGISTKPAANLTDEVATEKQWQDDIEPPANAVDAVRSQLVAIKEQLTPTINSESIEDDEINLQCDDASKTNDNQAVTSTNKKGTDEAWLYWLDKPIDHQCTAFQPGRYLDAYIASKQTSYIAFARSHQISLEWLCNIINGTTLIDVSTATKLATITPMTADDWLDVQLAWDTFLTVLQSQQ